jgi:hypothetical protein
MQGSTGMESSKKIIENQLTFVRKGLLPVTGCQLPGPRYAEFLPDSQHSATRTRKPVTGNRELF